MPKVKQDSKRTPPAKVKRITLPDTVPSTLTDEQLDILADSVALQEAKKKGQKVMVIGAGAGTGKTFTLKQLEQVLKGRGQYTAFNKTLVEESRTKFVKASVATTHSLAFQAAGRRFKHRLDSKRVRSEDTARILGIEDVYVTVGYEDGGVPAVEEKPKKGKKKKEQKPEPAEKKRRIKASYLASQVTQAIRRFCQSDHRQIMIEHLKYIDGVNYVVDGEVIIDNSTRLREYLLPFVEKAWADLTNETGQLQFNHDVYVKVWQLGTGPDRPVIAADYILLDEAQDTAPVFLDVLRQQTQALLVLVGDSNQAIYEWRGAVDAMKSFPGAPRRLLSQSWRFGQAVADVANTLLGTLEEPTDLVMKGNPDIPSRVCEVQSPACYLYRTNAGAISRLMTSIGEGKRACLIGSKAYIAEMIALCQAAVDLQEGRGTSHHELGCFDTWAEVVECSKEDEGEDLRLFVKLVEEFGAATIRDALRTMPPEENADLVTSTAHKSKGREWPTVKIGPDFPVANKLTDADRRLLYVACTRAQEELDITACPTFCGGYDYGETGDAESGGVWCEGLAIKYTKPQPTPEELAEYRSKQPAKPARGVVAFCPDNNGASSPVPSSAPPTNGSTAQGFTWANMDDKWRVRGPKNMTGQLVTVVRKNGTSSRHVLGKVVRVIGETAFYEV